MSFFAYIKNLQPWSEPRLIPQVFHDETLADYVAGQGHLVIVGKRHPLTQSEARLSIKELVKRYPSGEK
jgi:hypothetical protein